MVVWVCTGMVMCGVDMYWYGDGGVDMYWYGDGGVDACVRFRRFSMYGIVKGVVQTEDRL